MRRSSVALIVILAAQAAFAQSSSSRFIPNVAPPTPDATQLGRFGSYQVSHFTGIPDISIPLHTVKVGQIEIPITVKYHASGIKVTDRAGWVGLGWALDAGGIISRSVMGLADEVYGGYLNSVTIKPASEINRATLTGLQYLDDITNNRKDVEPDIYSYSIGNVSGKFLFNQADNYNIIHIPYEPINIIKTNSLNNLTFEAFDVNGINYKFNETFEESSGMTDYVSVRSAWMPAKIISKDKQDTVFFSYSSSTGITYADVTDVITVHDLIDDNGSGPISADYGVATSISHSITSTEQKLTEIKFPLGKVVFTLGEREDGWSGGIGTRKRLDNISVYDLDVATKTYTLSKTIRLYQSYFINSDGTKRLKLDSLNIQDKSSAVVQRYKFVYNPNYQFPGFTSRKRDYWGYYNGVDNYSLIPRITIPWQSRVESPQSTLELTNNPLNNRQPHSAYKQVGMLKKIIYPTGGWTEFEFEDNAHSGGLAGGLRIYKIRSYDGRNPTPLEQTFKYGEDESGVGRANYFLSNYFFQNEARIWNSYGIDNCPAIASARQRTFLSEPTVGIEPPDGSPVVYSVVTVYEGTPENNIGKTVYTYDDFSDVPNYDLLQVGIPGIYSYQFKRGLLTEKKVYKKSGSSYALIHITNNDYSAFPDAEFDNIGMRAIRWRLINGGGGIREPDACRTWDFTIDGNEGSFKFAHYRINTGDRKLIRTTEVAYPTDGSLQTISSTTNYIYGNSLHQQVTKIITANGIGETHEKSIKYPHDVSGPVYTAMKLNNLLAYPVEETTTRNSVLQERITRNYYQPSAYVFEPQTIQRQLESGPSETEVTFSGYDDKGNVLGYMGRGNVPSTYIWGYKKTFPIAATMGATASQVFHTSFEETNSNVSTATAKTGLRSWYNTAYTVVIPSAGTYRLTYWSKTGSGSWQLNESTISANTTIGGTDIYIDEVRVFPPGAKMTTHTYRVGNGISSTTDPNNITTYFEYDDFGRLAVVRDFDKNIVKSYKYSYKK